MIPTNQLKAKLKADLTSIANAIRERTGETDKLSIDQMKAEIEYMPVGDDGETYILVDENGNEIPAVLTEEEVDLTATANDIRLGSIAVTDDGIIKGTKEIPSYYTIEGYRVIAKGMRFEIPHLDWQNMYDFTDLQAVICAYTGSEQDSVATEKVVISGKVYNVLSADVVSTVVKDEENKRIDLGIVNDSDDSFIMRYIMYKEVE